MCRVTNHLAQCSCPQSFLGDPLVSCIQAAARCNGNCQCDESGYCIKPCEKDTDCSCGETCHAAKCRTKCSSRNHCARGQICKNNVCIAGCLSSDDCTNIESCISNKCQNPCAVNRPCGRNAVCKVSDHRSICLCPDGFHGEPTRTCTPFECRVDEDCDTDKRCDQDKVCRNSCQETGVCGENAQCKVINRKPHCSCPPGYIGNAIVECKQSSPDECLKNLCGENTKCKQTNTGYECHCSSNCIGDPYKGCVCDKELISLCKNKLCGVNALCKIINRTPQCYCPKSYPNGDPTIECK